MEYKIILAQRLKKMRQSKNLSQAALAEIAKVPQSAICEAEKGERMPKGDTISKMATSLDTTTSYLLGETEYQFVYEYSKEVS